MKSLRIPTGLLLLSIPCRPLAHPGHDGGLIDAAVAGLSRGQLGSVTAVTACSLVLAAIGLQRRRNAMSADD